MKIFDTATIKDLTDAFASKAMLTAMATLCIRFFMAYRTASVRFYTMTATIFFSCTYARKRIANSITHDRKFALFPGYAKQYCRHENPNL